MSIYPGDCFRSSDLMNDPYFVDCSIIIITVNTDSCIGFVYNKKFSQPLNALQEFNQCRNFPLFEGGPVDQEHLFFIHQQNNLIEGGQQIKGHWYFGGNFAQAIQLINTERIGPDNLKIFIGYCGWDEGELESEIDEGSWIKLPPASTHVF